MRSVRLSLLATLLLATLVASGGAGCNCGGGGGGGDDVAEPDAADPGPDAADPDAAAPDADVPDVPDAGPADAGIPVMSLSEIIPQAASRRLDTDLLVLGFNLQPGATLTLSNCDTSTVYDLSSTVTVAVDGRSLTAFLAMDPTREQGIYTVTVTNPDLQSDTLECAFRVLDSLPPTVTDVVPASAWNGLPGDGINSDETATISGTGFQPTPHVRFVKTDGTRTYDALYVGFNSTTEVTAAVPSETLAMEPGDYHVFVINPDLLSGQWLVDLGSGVLAPGIFVVTTTPPPDIETVTPERIAVNACTTTDLAITGTGFLAGATLWWVAPAGTTCAGGTTDVNGNVICPMSILALDATSITGRFSACPPNGAWPLMLINPDGQFDMFFNIEIRPNNAGHLDATAFDVIGDDPGEPALATARYRHAAEYGFDPFGSAYIYTIGGADAARAVLGDVEISQLTIFGYPSPFTPARQYESVANPRVANLLQFPRAGLAAVRVGRTIFAIGGATQASDVAAAVTASQKVESARILSYQEMPAIRQPDPLGGSGLPPGSWYYQVSAVGAWGESLASREVVALQTGGTIELCWDPPPLEDPASPSTYHVYRSLGSDGRAGTAAVIAYEVAATCFTDDGTAERTPAPGNLRGVLAAPTGAGLAAGDHAYRVSATLTLADSSTWQTYAGYAVTVAVTADDVTAGQNAIQVTWDPLPDPTARYHLFKWNPATAQFEQLDGAADLTATSFTDEGAGFAAPEVTPRTEIRPLPAGSLSRWSDAPPDLLVAREGLDAVVVHLDPATTTGGIAARIIAAGGRTANSNGSYLRSAESLGIAADGTVDAAWFDEQTNFTSARAFYALLTTQNRNETDFPPPPEEPPCSDFDGDGFIDCDCAPAGTPEAEIDCDDTDPTIYPGAPEVCGDGIDQDCDGAVCAGSDVPCACSDDLDLDDHISIECGGDDCCDAGDELSLGCDLTTAGDIHPGTIDICEDGIDQDCDGIDPPCSCADDIDLDGHVSIPCGGGDCCDTGADTSLGCTDGTADGIYPGSTEICDNGVDEDCDGFDDSCPIPAQRPLLFEALDWSGPGVMAPPARPTRAMYDLVGGEAVFLVAALGDDDVPLPAGGTVNNASSLATIEVCAVDLDGHLDCSGQWVVQDGLASTPQASFGIDGFLYFDYLYPFYGLQSESITATSVVTRLLIESSIHRFPVLDPDLVLDHQLLDDREAANNAATISRAYYKGLRLMSYLYLLGGWTDTGPTATLERHVQ